MLVTGGSGMIGSAFRRIYPDAEFPTTKEFHSGLYDIKNKHVVHLAAKVGGLRQIQNRLASSLELIQLSTKNFFTRPITIKQKK